MLKAPCCEPGMCIHHLLEEVRKALPQTSESLIFSLSIFSHENKSQFGMPTRSAGVCAQTCRQKAVGGSWTRMWPWEVGCLSLACEGSCREGEVCLHCCVEQACSPEREHRTIRVPRPLRKDYFHWFCVRLPPCKWAL